MDVTNSELNINTNLEKTDNLTLTKTINTILGIVKETMKRVKQIDNQVRKLSKETYKDITPATGVEFSNANSWSWAPTPISKFSETTSCCNQSIQYC